MSGGRSALVDPDGRWYDASEVSGGAVPVDPMAAWLEPVALHRATERLKAADANGFLAMPTSDHRFPHRANVFAVGLNYRAHADEANMKVPENPLVFTKFPSCLVGPTDDVILGGSTDDYEADSSS